MVKGALDARYAVFFLDLLVLVYWHSKVLDMGCARDAGDVCDVVLSQHLRNGFF